MLLCTVLLQAQEFNSVPLNHAAYDIIEMGILYGVCTPPPSAKPWSEETVKRLLWEIIDSPQQFFVSREIEIVEDVLESFERNPGLDLHKGRYRSEGHYLPFEAGLGWENSFSVEAPDASLSGSSFAKIYAGGDIGFSLSWNITAFGGFLYIKREERGNGGRTAFVVPPFFPYAHSRQWDGGVASLTNPGTSPWPDDPSLAGSFFAELNGIFWGDRLHLRLGRIRRDWGQSIGTSLFMNASARPFTAFEGSVSPLRWMHISFLTGAPERYGENGLPPDSGIFSNMLSLAQIEFTPGKFFHFGIGSSVIMLKQPNASFFTDVELRLPGLLTLWGGFFLDRMESFDNFSLLNGNSYAYQAGIKTIIRWLPLAAFTLRYTKIEPYCYTHTGGDDGFPSDSAYVNGGASLGYYLPPNSDEFFLGIESRLSSEIKAYISFQSLRHGADFGDKFVPGSSLGDKLDNPGSKKYFLMDGVYQWDIAIKVGGELSLRRAAIPCSFFTETGFVSTRFTINGTAGVSVEADYEPVVNDDIYRSGRNFIFSVGFRLFAAGRT